MALISLLVVALVAGVAYGSPARITGGSDAEIKDYPFLVQVEFEGTGTGIWSQSCGGSILTSVHVLSAAHCFHGALYAPTRRRVRCGSSTRGEGGFVAQVQYEVNHHSYGLNGDDGDITVVRLLDQLPWGPGIGQSIVVAQDFLLPVNLQVEIAGWGTTQVGGLPSNHLQKASVYTIDHNDCRDHYQSLSIPMEISENMICSRDLHEQYGSDACQGDYGGPVFYDNIVFGVMSWGITCGDSSFPSVSTSVASYSDWIVRIAV